MVILQFLGLKIDTFANARTTLEARKGVRKAFITTFRSCALMGFLLAANGLLVLWVSNSLFKLYYGDDWKVFLNLLLVLWVSFNLSLVVVSF